MCPGEELPDKMRRRTRNFLGEKAGEEFLGWECGPLIVGCTKELLGEGAVEIKEEKNGTRLKCRGRKKERVTSRVRRWWPQPLLKESKMKVALSTDVIQDYNGNYKDTHKDKYKDKNMREKGESDF